MAKSIETGLHIEYVPLGELKKWERNPREHDLSSLLKSVERFGFVSPPILDESSGQLVAGHGRLETLERMKGEGQQPPNRIIERDGALEGFTAYRAIKLVSGGYPFAKTDANGNFTGETESMATGQVMFLMRIDTIEPAANRYSGVPVTRVEATDMLSEASYYVASMPMQVGKYAGEILEAAMK